MAKKFVKLSEIAEKVMQEEFHLRNSKKLPSCDCGGSMSAMTSGLKSLDHLLGSFMPGQLYLIGGRPSTGKTTLLINIAVNIVASTNKSVYIHSGDMTAKQFVEKMISCIVHVNQRAVQSRKFSKRQNDLLYLCWCIMDAMPIYIVSIGLN